MKLSGLNKEPMLEVLTESMVPGSKSTLTDLGTYLPEEASLKQHEYYATPLEDLEALGFIGRVKHYDWTLEGVGLLVIGVIVLLFTIGAKLNQGKVESFIKAIRPTLDENFAQVGVNDKDLYIKDSANDFVSYATGRINIKSLFFEFKLTPRQNLLQYFFESVFSAFFEAIPTPNDSVDITLQFHSDAQVAPFTFAIVNKDGMNKARADNYYLSLSKTVEDETLLPVNFVFMSESAELNKSLVTPELTQLLGKSGKILKYFAVSDLPSSKPTTEAQYANATSKIHVKLDLHNDKQSLETINELLSELIKLADVIAAPYVLKADQQKKIIATRTQELTKLQKSIQDAKDEELRDAKLEAEREARRNNGLSRDEQDKLDKKMREKRERRLRNRMNKRG
ncbi:hypothetical protein WICPIJ_009960 [Wickerhamomyces pijperi]|uniref:Uncharacterized protein n=1 Tax=Wickerhamomyces pijperi TaxID=599730 RepID=A0A9P8TC81_WICPI|nr:hypothetical protein WICPIJ_009960 [Wickerhamomyces pijperi]